MRDVSASYDLLGHLLLISGLSGLKRQRWTALALKMWGASASHGRLFSPYHSRAHPTCLQQGVNSCRLRLICLDIRLSRPIRSRQTRSVQLPCSAQSSCKEPPLAWRHEAHGNRRGAGFRGRNTIPCGAAVGEAPAAGLAVEMQGIIVVVGEGSKRKEVTTHMR